MGHLQSTNNNYLFTEAKLIYLVRQELINTKIHFV